MKKINTIAKTIQDKHLEVKYNEKTITIDNKQIHVELQGKINCPILNQKISSLVCSKLMDQNGWPRHSCSDICDQANCKIYKSIKKNVNIKNEKSTKTNN